MPNKGWLKEVLAEARKEVNSRPDWQKNRVVLAKHQDNYGVSAPRRTGKSPGHVTVAPVKE